jgi:hypothetical protein
MQHSMETDGSFQKVCFVIEARRVGTAQRRKPIFSGVWSAEHSLQEVGRAIDKEPEIIHLQEVLRRPIEITQLISHLRKGLRAGR